LWSKAVRLYIFLKLLIELADIKLIIFKKKAMKCIRINLFVIFLSLFPALGYSQERQPEPERGSVLPGFIITLQGDTVKGYLLNINLWLNQKMTFFYTNPDDREGRGQVHAKRDQGLPGRPQVL